MLALMIIWTKYEARIWAFALESSFNVYCSKNNLLSRSHDLVNGPKQREAEICLHCMEIPGWSDVSLPLIPWQY